MAIHDKFEVRVFVKGEPVHEYDGPENCTDPLADGKKAHRKPGPVVKRCIESVPGENFAIELKTNQGFDLKPRQALSFVIEVDGKIANGTIATKKVYDSGSGWMHTVEGASDCNRGIWQLRKFRFQNLHTDTVPSNEKLDARKVAKIGSIRVRVRRVKLIKQGAPELKEDDRGKSQITVSERHLKGQAIDSQTG